MARRPRRPETAHRGGLRDTAYFYRRADRFPGRRCGRGKGTPAGLKKSVLSLRHLWDIVKPWKAHNYDRPIDDYILNEFIKPAVAEDQVYLVQLFCRFRFFKDWTADRFEMPGLTPDKLAAFQGRQAH